MKNKSAVSAVSAKSASKTLAVKEADKQVKAAKQRVKAIKAQLKLARAAVKAARKARKRAEELARAAKPSASSTPAKRVKPATRKPAPRKKVASAKPATRPLVKTPPKPPENNNVKPAAKRAPRRGPRAERPAPVNTAEPASAIQPLTPAEDAES
jgi:hypothetical protein